MAMELAVLGFKSVPYSSVIKIYNLIVIQLCKCAQFGLRKSVPKVLDATYSKKC
jgi:hypothetical protein